MIQLQRNNRLSPQPLFCLNKFEETKALVQRATQLTTGQSAPALTLPTSIVGRIDAVNLALHEIRSNKLDANVERSSLTDVHRITDNSLSQICSHSK